MQSAESHHTLARGVSKAETRVVERCPGTHQRSSEWRLVLVGVEGQVFHDGMVRLKFEKRNGNLVVTTRTRKMMRCIVGTLRRENQSSSPFLLRQCSFLLPPKPHYIPPPPPPGGGGAGGGGLPPPYRPPTAGEGEKGRKGEGRTGVLFDLPLLSPTTGALLLTELALTVLIFLAELALTSTDISY